MNQQKEKINIIELEKNDDLPDININNDDDILKPETEKDIPDFNLNEPLFKAQPKSIKEVISIEERLSKKAIMMKIQRWKVGFPSVLSSVHVSEKMDIEELASTEKECEFLVSANNGGDVVQALAMSSAAGIEMSAPYLGLELEGYKNTLFSNPAFVNTLKEISIKYSDSFHTDPVSRLCLSMAYTATIVHTHNSQKKKDEIQNNIKKTDLNEDIKKKFNDI